MSNSIKIIHAEEILLSISEHFLIENLSMYNASLSLSLKFIYRFLGFEVHSSNKTLTNDSISVNCFLSKMQ